MKKSNLSIEEFKHICNELSPKEFIIASDNQEYSYSQLGVSFCLVFTTMFAESNPDVICFNDKELCIKFDRVKYLRQRRKSLLGNIFDIVCSGLDDETKEYTHTVIVR